MWAMRGNIYKVNLDPIIGSEQGGERPALVLQNDLGNWYSPTVVIAPISTKINKKQVLPTHVELSEGTLQEKSVVLIEQMRAIDKKRLGACLGTVCLEDMKQIDQAIMIGLGVRGMDYEN